MTDISEQQDDAPMDYNTFCAIIQRDMPIDKFFSHLDKYKRDRELEDERKNDVTIRLDVVNTLQQTKDPEISKVLISAVIFTHSIKESDLVATIFAIYTSLFIIWKNNIITDEQSLYDIYLLTMFKLYENSNEYRVYVK